MRILPLDLHVLGTPPAFILSQDQTLQKESDFLVQIELTLIVQPEGCTLSPEGDICTTQVFNERL